MPHEIFFRVNALLGRVKWLDRSALFITHAGIFLLMIAEFAWAHAHLSPQAFIHFATRFGIGFLFCLCINYLLAWRCHCPRPIVEYPETKQLFRPLETWKSFPSDHTTIAVFSAVLALKSGASWEMFLLFIGIAVLVAFSRVYAGVHYPRDIIGGALIGAIVAGVI